MVTFEKATADSILALIDQQAVRIWELERLAAADSVATARQLELQREQYERMLALYRAEEAAWWQRVWRSPALWLAVGGYLGVRAAK